MKSENYSVTIEHGPSGEKETIELGDLAYLPREGEIVECNYVHGTKLKIRVSSVRHFLFNSGSDIVQNVIIEGDEV